MDGNFHSLYARKAEVVTQYLTGLFPEVTTVPEPLYGAMKYSVLSGGKRLRPVLLITAADLFGAGRSEAMNVAAALEMIHTYSLIHDDLPAMDDDTMRRGRPTNHMIYGEGMAVLAGDALLNLAYETLLEGCVTAKDMKSYLKASNIIARAAGARGMVGGQCVDLTSESSDTVTEKELMFMHRNKTGRLIEAALLAGAVLGGAGEEAQKALVSYGEYLGLAFQITDDILDILGDSKTLGKPVGSDIDKDKLTFPKVYGIEKSREMCVNYVEKAVESLAMFEDNADFFRDLARSMLERES